MKRDRSTFVRGPAAYRRTEPTSKLPGKAFLIVTEGAKTEPNYFKALRNRLELSAVKVAIVHPECTDPLTLVREAVRLREEQSARARQSLSAVPYDAVWIVFDLERTHDQRRQLATQAKASPEAATLHFAESDPTFEYWLLLHMEYTTAVFEDAAAVIRRLKKHWQDYTKNSMPSADFLAKTPQAVNHARQRRRDHLDPGCPEHPFTDVDWLVCELNASTREHLRFPILPQPASSSQRIPAIK